MSGTDEYVAVAIIVRPHALGGACMLKPLTRTPEEFLDAPIERVYTRRRGLPFKQLTITDKGLHKGLPIIYFAEVEDRNAAEALIGAELVIPTSERWDLEPGRYYVDDLVGLAVEDAETGETLGKVEKIMDGNAHDYLVFDNPKKKGREVLLPFTEPFLVSVDLDAKVVRVKIPEGLLDL